MNKQNFLDYLIKRFDNNGYNFSNKGYVINDKNYDNYMTNEHWNAFLNEMKNKYNNAFNQYSKGDGGELEPRKKNSYPPKMASFGSSSHMIYMHFREVNGFYFEKKSGTTMGGNPANIDGYIKICNRHLYFEAKCREIYTSPKTKVSKAYGELFKLMSERKCLQISTTETSDKKLSVTFVANGTKIKRFDTKQIISIFLGIANQNFDDIDRDVKIEFYYMIYNPTDVLENGIKNGCIKQRKYDDIKKDYNEILEEIRQIDFKQLFSVIVDYLVEKKGSTIFGKREDAEKLKKAFEFKCVSQNFELK